MNLSTIFHSILLIIFIILIIGTILVVISENRNPIRTLSWILILILLPGVGLLFFYFFGQDTQKMKNISAKYYKRIKDKSFNLLAKDCNIEAPPQYSTLVALLENNNYSFPISGSEVEVITKGERKFEALLEDMENARHHIHMEYFIFDQDNIGKKIKEVLMKKASEGVQVRFLYDNVANWAVPQKFYDAMKTTGVEVSSFMNVKLPAFHSKVNYRNHRKVVVIDGAIGYIGGMNVGDNYKSDPNWRDTHLRITGRGVHGLQAKFLTDWYFATNSYFEPEPYFPPLEAKTDNLMQIVTGGPTGPWYNLLQATNLITMTAKKYIYIQTPYFLPTDSLLQSLQTAALGKIDIRLMVSAKSDSPYVDPAAHSYYEDLLRSGMRIYEIQGKFLHAKTIVSDDMLSVIGSANMDFRSFESNFEINCYMYDEKIALRNKEIFLEDMKECKEILLEEWVKRSRWKKLIESFMQLFAPLM